MADIISGELLAAQPGVQGYTPEQLAATAVRVNALVSESWAAPVPEAPQWVIEIALDVATRYLANPKGLESWTRSVDDASRTERIGVNRRTGLYLDDDQKRRLRGRGAGKAARSVRLAVPGYQP